MGHKLPALGPAISKMRALGRHRPYVTLENLYNAIVVYCHYVDDMYPTNDESKHHTAHELVQCNTIRFSPAPSDFPISVASTWQVKISHPSFLTTITLTLPHLTKTKLLKTSNKRAAKCIPTYEGIPCPHIAPRKLEKLSRREVKFHKLVTWVSACIRASNFQKMTASGRKLTGSYEPPTQEDYKQEQTLYIKISFTPNFVKIFCIFKLFLL